MLAIVWLVLGGVALTVGDILFRFWVDRPSYLSALYISGLAIYLIGLIFLVESFKSENIAVASAIFVIINIATLVVVSWLWFDDKLSLLQIIGLALALIAIVLLELGGKVNA